MKKTLQNTILLIIVCTAMVFITGCQKKEDAQLSAAAKTTEKITLWVYDSGRIEVLTKIGKQFKEEYGVAVEVALVELGEIRNQFLLASGGEECADMAIIPHDNLGALVVNDAVVEMDLGEKAKNYLKPSLEGFNYNGKLFGIPLAVENIGFFWNPEMMSTSPKTWEEVYQIGKELVDSGKAEYIMGFPDATYNMFPVYTANGGYIFGKDSSGSLTAEDIGLAKPGFVKGMEYMTKLVKEGYATEVIDWDGAHVLFETGKAPFICTGPWALNRFKTAGITYKISSFPDNGAPFLGVQGVVVSSASKNILLAQTFLKDFLATETNMQMIFDAEQRPSAWKAIFENSGNDDVAGFNAAGVNAIPMPSIPEMGYVWDAWKNAAALAFSEDLTPEEALKNATTQIKTQIEEGK